MGAEERWEVGRKGSVGGQLQGWCNGCKRTVDRRAFKNTGFHDGVAMLQHTAVGGRPTHLTLTLVQMMYSISSEKGF